MMTEFWEWALKRTNWKCLTLFKNIFIFFFNLFWLQCIACEIFSSWTRDRTCALCIGRCSLNHWMPGISLLLGNFYDPGLLWHWSVDQSGHKGCPGSRKWCICYMAQRECKYPLITMPSDVWYVLVVIFENIFCYHKAVYRDRVGLDRSWKSAWSLVFICKEEKCQIHALKWLH